MVKYTGGGLVVKRPGVLSKDQIVTLVLGVGVFSLLPSIFCSGNDVFGVHGKYCNALREKMSGDSIFLQEGTVRRLPQAKLQ